MARLLSLLFVFSSVGLIGCPVADTGDDDDDFGDDDDDDDNDDDDDDDYK